ncbi:MAG: twin-arginine translocation signal domain-containing protein [Acidobacteria bacterium]|nr:MAG: twin-arginine translocation signal domain-containing protein [Acidobacteriota bacterium]
MDSINRRQFLKAGSVATAGIPFAANVLASQAAATRASSRMIAIQIGAVSFVDEGIEKCLDILQERGAVNTVMPAVYSNSRGTAGRHKPYPGHGKNVEDMSINGGNYATVHPSFYKDISIDPRATQATDHPGFDVLRDLIPHTRKRGMKVIGLFQNSFNEKLPGADKLFAYDFNGKQTDALCFNNPYHRRFLTGLVDDFVNSYDIDGLMYVNETQGAFTDMMGGRFRGRERGLPGSRICFCPYCIDKAKAQGIRVERLKAAFEEAEKFVAAGRVHQRPVDGFYVSFWRLLLRHPELLHWEHLYHESYREVYTLMYDHVKAANKKLMFGLHIWTNTSMNPIYRAEQDFSELSRCADFLKLALYNNCGGPRMASYIQSIGDTVYGDLSREEATQFHYRVLNYPNEAPYPRVSEAGLSAHYVYREVKRALDGRGNGGAKILAGIDVDIPLSQLDIVDGAQLEKAAQTTRERVRNATREALRANADGIVISRKYSEMKLDNLSGIGDAVRELS